MQAAFNICHKPPRLTDKMKAQIYAFFKSNASNCFVFLLDMPV